MPFVCIIKRKEGYINVAGDIINSAGDIYVLVKASLQVYCRNYERGCGREANN